MSRAEIHHKFDEIVAFSGVEKFIDTPVKHYSSGMGVRLAFSVAAHLEPEILIIDEVLAVGDATFQRKCLGKMEEVARTGRTVLFVSHNMGAITNLCCSAMWLDYGEIRKSGDVAATTSAYLTSTSDTSACMSKHWNRSGTGEARITDACLLDLEGNERDAFMMGETIVVEFDIEFHRFLPSINLAVEIKRIEDGLSVLHSVNEDCGFNIDINNIGISRFRVEIQNCLLYPSSYTIMIWTGINNISTFDYVSNILNFTIYQGNISKRTFHFTNSRGIFYQHSLWSKIL
jgi:lipopolysaccharide transport system ATP-binding protein